MFNRNKLYKEKIFSNTWFRFRFNNKSHKKTLVILKRRLQRYKNKDGDAIEICELDSQTAGYALLCVFTRARERESMYCCITDYFMLFIIA